MLAGLKSRCHGCRIACVLARSLFNITHAWKTSAPPAPFLFGVQLERGDVKVLVYANPKCPCQRSCDEVRVLIKGCDIFIPLLSRLKLRAAARYRSQLFAETEL